MTIPKRSLVYGAMGLAPALLMLFNLATGTIYSRRSATYRETDPFQFYLGIFFYALLATIFIGTGIFFFLHPHFSLVASPHVTDD